MNSVIERVRERLIELPELVPSPTLDVAVGLAADVITRTAKTIDAGLVVVGAKRHGVLGRWFGGSTVHALVRNAAKPVLVTAEPASEFNRVLVAVDLSDCACCVVDYACNLAKELGAAIRIVHVVETLPIQARQYTGISQKEFHQLSCEICEDLLGSRVGVGIDRIVREGEIVPVLRHEIDSWAADLLVVGSHGASRMSRLVLGSTTETLLKDLPVSTLFVPPPDDPQPLL